MQEFTTTGPTLQADPEESNPAAVPESAGPFGVLRQRRFPAPQVLALEAMLRSFAQHAPQTLSAYLRIQSTAGVASIEELTVGEHLDRLQPADCCLEIRFEPLGAKGLLQFDPALVFPVLEALMGMPGESAEVFPRRVTEIEERLLEPFLDIILKDIRFAAASSISLVLSARWLHSDAERAKVLPSHSTVIVAAVRVSIGSRQGTMKLVLPASVLEALHHPAVEERHSDGIQAETEIERLVLERVLTAKLNLIVTLPGAPIPLRALARLRPGDILDLSCPITSALDCAVNGVSRFTGQVGEIAGKQAFRIEQVLPAAQEPAARD